MNDSRIHNENYSLFYGIYKKNDDKIETKIVYDWIVDDYLKDGWVKEKPKR